jgi:choline transport protein
MVTACIVLLYISYSIPVILLLMKGRNNIKPGPFWFGPFGHFCNYVLLAWTLFTLVMYSFPYTKPVTPGSMNYVSAVYAVTFSIIGLYWVARGKRTFRSREEREGISSTIPVPVIDHTKTVAI